MARKVYYSKPLKYFWQNFYGIQKKLTPEYTDDQIFAILRNNILNAPLRSFDNEGSRQLIVSGLELWRQDSRGELLHIFFLDRQLRSFLESTPLSDLENIKKFLNEKGTSKDIFHIYSKIQSNRQVYQFALHLPYESEGYAFSLSLEDDNSVQLYFSLADNGGLMSDKFYSDVNKKEDEISLIQSKMFRLAINTIAYMNCFPDCVVDGVPKDLLERSEDLSAKNFTLSTSEKIKEKESSPLSKMPHFRKGHFKLLKSNYFVHKKGQFIFVSETMVKGRAKTVSTSPEIDRFGDIISSET
ncbi:hypothetical protein [Flavobacterium sp. AG291]|uniref:hypothetical protein n=1 Tax=Flavobacterium sp. AG291 TaxID=2184000 RepID=UPI000E0AF312|nr:hypothetical protein [Flavobacterium sp. AG291]RDI11268.1 hypothetical protein DEU42_106202 [Flavobacterium sp. AG291]